MKSSTTKCILNFLHSIFVSSFSYLVNLFFLSLANLYYPTVSTKKIRSTIPVSLARSLYTSFCPIYRFCYYSCPPSTEHPQLPSVIPPPLFMSLGHAYKLFGNSISYTVLNMPLPILQLPICIF